MKRLANYINGEFVAPKEGRYLPNYNPATGEVYSEIPDSGLLDVVAAIQSANKAFETWSKIKTSDRADFLYKIADRIDARADELALAESIDQGKPVKLAKNMDIKRAALNFRFFAGAILHHKEMATEADGGLLNYTTRSPLGVAGLITPWNLPLYLLTWKIAPALACGNTAVCKPSEFTPMTASLLCEIFSEVGLPPGVCNMVHGTGQEVGNALVAHPGVPLISFTGGTVTGEKIQQTAAPHFKKLSLELGGKNANIIFNDADLRLAVPTSIRSSFLNQGEICLCGSRIFVQEDIYEKFLEDFVKQTEALKVGDPLHEDTFMGPVVSRAHYDKVMSKIEQAKQEKGKILAGGGMPQDLDDKHKKGYFIRPTIIADLDYCSTLQQEEIFGPVVTISSFKYANEAVKWANTTPYGLSASIWTQDVLKAHKIASQLKVGTVWVNCWLERDLRVPFGGVKASGIGREGGDYSIDFYTEVKNICLKI